MQYVRWKSIKYCSRHHVNDARDAWMHRWTLTEMNVSDDWSHIIEDTMLTMLGMHEYTDERWLKWMSLMIDHTSLKRSTLMTTELIGQFQDLHFQYSHIYTFTLHSLQILQLLTSLTYQLQPVCDILACSACYNVATIQQIWLNLLIQMFILHK